MKRKRVSTIGVVCAALIIIGPVVRAQSHSEDSPEPAASIVVGPYLQAAEEEAITVMWLTDKRSTGWVEYGTDSGNLDRIAVSVHDGLVDAYTTTHKIRLTGLRPATRYYYRVMSEEILEFGPYYDKKFSRPFGSEVNTFKTFSVRDDVVSVICLNDVHDNGEMMRDLLKVGLDEPVDAVFLNGDIMEALFDEAQVVSNVLKPCADLFAKNVPFCYARGNHETRGPFARWIAEYFDSPGLNNFYYAFTCGPVHFIILDCGEDKVDSHAVYANLNRFDDYRTKQAEWLKEHVETKEFRNAPWRVLMTHMPIEATASRHGVLECWDKFSPYLNGTIDLNVAGHTHRFRIVEPSPDQGFPVVVGGDNKEEGATVIRMDATDSAIDITVKNLTGEIIGTYKIKK
jgi:hypothetical protein